MSTPRRHGGNGRARAVLLAAAFVALAAGDALAKAPTLEELPTVRKVFADAVEAKELAAKLAAEAEKDPKLDLIKDYEEGRSSLYKWKDVAEILRQDKDRDYRDKAAWALRQRIRDLPQKDVTVIRTKHEIGTYLVKLLKSSTRDIRQAVAGIFRDFWPGDYARIGYDPNEASPSKLSRKVRDWERFFSRR